MKKIFIIVCALIFSMPAFAANKPLKVVTSTTLFAGLMQKIGGQHVEVKSIASPKFNIHFIQPTPKNVRETAHADLFVFAGLDLETWVDPLLEAAGNPNLFRGAAQNLDLSQRIILKKIPPLLTRSEGDLHAFGNPHYTLSPENLRIMAQTAAAKLTELDSAHAEDYANNLNVFISRLDEKIAGWKQICAHCSGKEVFAYHDDVVYLTDFLSVKEGRYLEPKPGVPPAPKHLAFLEAYAKDHQVRSVLFEPYYSEKAVKKIADKIGVKAVMIVQTCGGIDGTQDLFDFYEYNISAVADALKQ